MPIDPQIPLQGRQFELPTFPEAQAQGVRMRSAQLDYQLKEREAKDQQQLRQIFQEHVNSGGDPNDLKPVLGKVYAVNPMLGMKFQGMMQEQQKQQAETARRDLQTKMERREDLSKIMAPVLTASDADAPNVYQSSLKQAADMGLVTPADGLPMEYTPAVRAQLRAGLMMHEHGRAWLEGNGLIQPRAQKPNLKWIEQTDAEGKTTGQFIPEEPGKTYEVSGGKGSMSGQDIQNVKDTVDGWKTGLIPPELPGRSSRLGTALMAEAKRQGFDLVKANEDWKATQRYVQTLNGTQQVRLRQAVTFTKEFLPNIERLVDEWDAKGPALLTKANMILAEQGVYGSEWASKARLLKGQIADLTSELGTVYKGGNSSTDESLKLAAQNISADWDSKSMKNALKQIGDNLQVRENSLRHGAPTTVTGRENPYVPPTGGGNAADPLGILGGR